MRWSIPIVFLVFAIAAAPAWARASGEMTAPTPATDPESPAVNAGTAPVDEDFGWQVAVADVAGFVTTIGLATAIKNPGFLVPWLIAAPTVHIVHSDGKGAVGSFLLNAGMPIAGGFVGYELTSANCTAESGDFCGLGGLAVGVLIGVGLAAAVDAIALSHPNRRDAVAARPKQRFEASPTVAIDPAGRFSLALAGRF